MGIQNNSEDAGHRSVKVFRWHLAPGLSTCSLQDMYPADLSAMLVLRLHTAFSRWQTVCLTFPPGKVPGLLCRPEGALRDALATELNSTRLTAGPLSEGQSLRNDEKSLDIPQSSGSQSQFPLMAAQTDEDVSNRLGDPPFLKASLAQRMKM